MSIACTVSVIAASSSVVAIGASPKHDYCRNRGALFTGAHAFVGINDTAWPGGGPAYRGCTPGAFAAADIAYVRYPFSWATIETRPHHYDFTTYDALVSVLATHHLHILAVLLDAPRFRQRHVGPHGSVTVPPAHAQQFASFAALVARRYGPGGTFWKQYPTLPRVPIRAWQIWNEPNLSPWWWPKPDPAAYTSLLRASYRAIKRVDPRSDVVTAGMPFYSASIPALDFLRAIFRDGGGKSFDTVAFHPYAPTVRQAVMRVFNVRSVMNHGGARRKPIWITEFGWASGGPANPYVVGPRRQRTFVARFFHYVALDRARLRLRGVMYTLWRDQPKLGGTFDFWGLHTGVFTVALKPKRALSALLAAARSFDR